MTTAQLLTTALSGLGLGLGLIVAIGAQNALVLRQGIRREHVLAVVAVCAVSDALLIAAGVAGAGALFTAQPWLVTVARWAGAAFLLAYAVLAARRALRRPGDAAAGLTVDASDTAGEDGAAGPRPTLTPRADSAPATTGATLTAAPPLPTRPVTPGARPTALLPVLGTTLALTWLNPHVYLDTVVLLGSVGSSHGEGRWAFAAGAVLGSLLWFSALGVAARALAPVFARPGAWRVLDAVIAVVMTAVAAGLLLGA